MEFNKQYFLDKLRYDYSDLRDGQILFNEVFKVFPKECRQLVNSKYDCYFDDGKIEDFLTMIRLLVEKKEDIGITRPYTICYSSQEIDAEKALKEAYATNEKLDDIIRSCEEQPTISFDGKNNFIENNTYQSLRYWIDKVYKRNKKSLKIFYRLGESMEKRKIREAKK